MQDKRLINNGICSWKKGELVPGQTMLVNASLSAFRTIATGR